MGSRGKMDLTGRCPRCFVVLEYCICPYIPRVETRTRFIVVRHMIERFKSSNTARVAALALPNCTVWDWGIKDQPLPADLLVTSVSSMLLFPAHAPVAVREPPATVVVLDGSWSQARHMMQKIPALQTMPRLVLPAPVLSAQRLRQPPHPEGMSTLEAMANTVGLLESAEQGELLMRLHALFVGSVLATKGRRIGDR